MRFEGRVRTRSCALRRGVAASQLVDEIVRKGYAERRAHPVDARAKLIVLTGRGWACTRAAEEAAAEVVQGWSDALGEAEARALGGQLGRIAPYGPIRPAWWGFGIGYWRVSYHWKFLLTRNFTLALLARNLTSEQHPS